MTDADQALLAGVLRSDRRALAKAITLLESTLAPDRARADAILDALMPHSGRALRIGVSGPPGVGKSTFIEALGLHLVAGGATVAVLAVDPSSSVSGGSILGDKTRMERLSVHEAAYIRPTPASGNSGGVAEKTREALFVCEAAGHSVVIVETVGVGQSESAVAGMTDLFVLMQLPNAGDELQAIKKGVMELADIVLVNKSDLDPAAATRAQAQLVSALRVSGTHGNAGATRVAPEILQVSAATGAGIGEFWEAADGLRRERVASGAFAARRNRQALAWMWDIVHARLQADFHAHPGVRAALAATLADVGAARRSPASGARALMAAFACPPKEIEP